MKKILLIFLSLFALFSLNINSNATTSASYAGIVETNGGNLNVRKGASTTTEIIASLKNNSYVTIISTINNFYYVEYQENTYGYVCKDYIRISSTNTKMVSTGGSNLNVRTGPSINYAQFEKIRDKDYVIVLREEGNFSRVLFEGNKVGYVSNTYLSQIQAYPKISLPVVSYKQYDERWANLTLGSSGKTIRQIGCLTTCMAMSESYRTSATKTPAIIRNTANYTSDGSLYWPSNYTTSTATNYKATIYNQLKQGKPVLIGLKNNYGGQHWVLIVGYQGGNTLDLNNFTINDPASNSTKLSEVLKNYPYFYKIAYYN